MKTGMVRFLSVLLALMMTVISFGTVAYAKENICYVSSSGSDTTGDGSLEKPYASLSKAYEALASGGTIALLSDISMTNDTRLIINSSNSYTITSARADGSLVENEAGDYTDVHSVLRGSTTYSMIYHRKGTVTLTQAIFDGEDKTFVPTKDDGDNWYNGGFILRLAGDKGDTTFTLGTNAAFRNNRNTGNSKPWGGGVCVGIQDSQTVSPQLYLKDNAEISGCVAPRHGGAITSYSGDVYIQDNASLHDNAVGYNKNWSDQFYGGCAILVYSVSKLHLSGNASITGNCCDPDNCPSSKVFSGCQPNAVQVAASAKIDISGNVTITDNIVKNADQTFGMQDNEQANLFDATSSGGALIISGALGEDAKIGARTKNNAAGDTVAVGTSSYTVTEADADKFFDDTGKFVVAKAASANKLVFAEGVTEVSMSVTADSSWTTFTGTLDKEIAGLSAKDFTVYLGGEKVTEGFTVKIKGTTFTITFDQSVMPTQGREFAVSISKNGYKVVGASSGSTVEKLTPAAGSASVTANKPKYTEGEQATLTVTVSVKQLKSTGKQVDTFTYQWYTDTNDGSGFVPVSGATGSSYTTPELALENDGDRYRCDVSDSLGNTVQSNAVALKVVPKDIPTTGDDNRPVMWAILGMAAALGVVLLRKKRA